MSDCTYCEFVRCHKIKSKGRFIKTTYKDGHVIYVNANCIIDIKQMVHHDDNPNEEGSCTHYKDGKFVEITYMDKEKPKSLIVLFKRKSGKKTAKHIVKCIEKCAIYDR